jgi:ATP-binding cassette, subfamily F, member 3
LLLNEMTWLAMDEPTNHLDLAARTALEELLGAFDGALVCVSHDRAFLDALCTQILLVDGGRVRIFSGSYSDYRRARSLEEASALDARRETQRTPAQAPPASAAPRPESGGKIRNPWAFQRLEARIIELEGLLAQLHTELASEAVYRDAERMRETQTRIAEAEHELAEHNERWENWS